MGGGSAYACYTNQAIAICRHGTWRNCIANNFVRISLGTSRFTVHSNIARRLAGFKFRLAWRPLTHLVGLVEVIGLALLVNHYLTISSTDNSDPVSSVGLYILGWFAIKFLGHELSSDKEGHTWPDEKRMPQTVIRYKVILGTIFSLAGGVILGLFLFNNS